MKRKTRVAEFITFTGDGGVEALVKDYALMLDPNKFEVIIITIQRVKKASVDRILRKNNIRIISLYNYIYSSKTLIAKLIRKTNNIWYIPYMIKRIIMDEHIDVLHIHPVGVLHHILRISPYLKKVKLLFTCHTVAKSTFKGKELAAAKELVRNHNMQIIALHEDMKDEINSLLDINNTVVIKNGIDFDRFKKVAFNKEQCRERIRIPANAFVVGNIGRFVDSKNHKYLIRIFFECYKRNKNSFLLLIGDGENKDSIVKQLEDYDLHDNYMILSNRTDIPQLLKCMDVFVFPSEYEGFGIVLIEAQVAGIRCVASDTIPKAVFQTELAIPMSLKDSPKQWCDVIMNPSIKGKSLGDIEQYNMRKEILKLEELYRN